MSRSIVIVICGDTDLQYNDPKSMLRNLVLMMYWTHMHTLSNVAIT